jgi:hypothetical protein
LGTLESVVSIGDQVTRPMDTVAVGQLRREHPRSVRALRPDPKIRQLLEAADTVPM